MKTEFVFNPITGEFDMVNVDCDSDEQDTLVWEEL